MRLAEATRRLDTIARAFQANRIGELDFVSRTASDERLAREIDAARLCSGLLVDAERITSARKVSLGQKDQRNLWPARTIMLAGVCVCEIGSSFGDLRDGFEKASYIVLVERSVRGA